MTVPCVVQMLLFALLVGVPAGIAIEWCFGIMGPHGGPR